MSFVIQPVNLSAAAIQGVLPADHGGTTLTTFGAANRALYSTSATALAANTLPVAAGGTGATSLTANNVLLGNGTSALQTVAPGTSGNVLTSTGTSWSSQTLLAGVITGTASGSISTGNTVQVNGDGTLSAPTVTVGATSIGATNSVASDYGAGCAIIYCPSPGVYVAFYGDSVNGYVAGRIGTPQSDGSITWSSQTILNSSYQFLGRYAAVYISSGLAVVTAAATAGNPGIILPVTVTSSTLTAGTAAYSGRSDDYTAVDWNSSLSVGGVLSKDGATGYMTMTGFTISGTTVTSGTPTGNNGSSEFNMAFDPTSGYFLVVARSGGVGTCVQAFAINASRVVTEYTSTSVYASGTALGYGIRYVSGPNKVLIATSNGTNPVLFYVNMTGTTPSAVGTAVSSATVNSRWFNVGYDSTNNVACVSFPIVTTGYQNVQCFTVSGTTITLGSATQVSTTASNTSTQGKMAFDSANTRLCIGLRSGSPFGTVSSVTFKTTASTLTSNNFIGFSKDNYTNGQTAQVYVVSGVATGLSGVSIGVKNYASGLGVTTTDTGIYAGIGLSATSLLVKG